MERGKDWHRGRTGLRSSMICRSGLAQLSTKFGIPDQAWELKGCQSNLQGAKARQTEELAGRHRLENDSRHACISLLGESD